MSHQLKCKFGKLDFCTNFFVKTLYFDMFFERLPDRPCEAFNFCNITLQAGEAGCNERESVAIVVCVPSRGLD